MEDRIRAIIQESVELHGRISPLVPRIKQAAELMCAALARGGTPSRSLAASAGLLPARPAFLPWPCKLICVS